MSYGDDHFGSPSSLYGDRAMSTRSRLPDDPTVEEVIDEACRLLDRLGRGDVRTRLRECVQGTPRARQTHELRTWPDQYAAVVEGRKTHEVRRDDRDFRTGDRLWLQEYVPTAQRYTGSGCLVEVTYVTRPGDYAGVAEGHCVMTVRLVDDVRPVPLPR